MWHLVDHGARTGGYTAAAILPVLRAGLEPTLRRHGMRPAHPRQMGWSIVWCTPATELRVAGGDYEQVGCTDLWVEVDPARQAFYAHLEGNCLLRHLRGVSGWCADIAPLPLAPTVAESVHLLDGYLDDFCAELLVRP